MDLGLACIVCNWSRDLWESIGLGGFGAAAAAAAAAAGGHYEDRYADEAGDVTQDVHGHAPATSIEEREAAWHAGRSLNSRFKRWAFDAQHDLTYTVWGDPRHGVGPPGRKIIGTVAGTVKDTGGLGYDADYDGRDYEQNPSEPPGPRP
jgi:hypothetical protein